jgi:hypothetical protein
MASTPSGQGVWILDSKGNILSFGDAPEFREVPEPQPWRGGSFVSIASTPAAKEFGFLTIAEASSPSATRRNSVQS